MNPLYFGLIPIAAYLGLSVFYSFAVFAISFYGDYLAKKLTAAPLALGAPWLVLFILTDWLVNQTVCRLLFWDRPATGRELVTGRMSRYAEKGQGWRQSVGVWVCAQLNAIARTGRHCT